MPVPVSVPLSVSVSVPVSVSVQLSVLVLVPVTVLVQSPVNHEITTRAPLRLTAGTTSWNLNPICIFNSKYCQCQAEFATVSTRAGSGSLLCHHGQDRLHVPLALSDLHCQGDGLSSSIIAASRSGFEL